MPAHTHLCIIVVMEQQPCHCSLCCAPSAFNDRLRVTGDSGLGQHSQHMGIGGLCLQASTNREHNQSSFVCCSSWTLPRVQCAQHAGSAEFLLKCRVALEGALYWSARKGLQVLGKGEMCRVWVQGKVWLTAVQKMLRVEAVNRFCAQYSAGVVPVSHNRAAHQVRDQAMQGERATYLSANKHDMSRPPSQTLCRGASCSTVAGQVKRQ
jgi:hypothetical protein